MATGTACSTCLPGSLIWPNADRSVFYPKPRPLPSKVRIANPLHHGQTHTTYASAMNFVRKGMAEIGRDGMLHFTLDNQIARSMEQEFANNRGGVLFWNGAREQYIPDTDIGTAMFPPGCNVLFPKGGSERARRRYA
jgi:hypothetical protein